jgi:hypothetical protein
VGKSHLDHLGTSPFLVAYRAGGNLVGGYIHEANFNGLSS